MADAKPTTTDAKPVEKKAPALAKAAESGDAAVQQLLAVREIHLVNDDADKVAAVDQKLEALGYTAR